MSAFKTIFHKVDFCVVGGGLAGLCAAVAAARHGAKVALMQERPVLGGNASSEIRMWVCGAQGENVRETGIIEEILLENQYRNPDKNFSIWDGILYEFALNEPNLTLLLNCSCNDCRMDGGKIASVTGWQMTTQTFQTVEAKLFADCSGDSILAPLTGADFRIGREAKAEFGESLGQDAADRKTMGMSCMIQAREEAHPSTFIPPKWAHHYTADDLYKRVPDLADPSENFWYLELGGEDDSIADSETLRDELLKTAYGLWDFVKNDPSQREKNANWRLDWVGMLPGKRESRRYLGEHLLTQAELTEGTAFPDTVAYGGWGMDDHDPQGFRGRCAPNHNGAVHVPYGIPYRCLYSRNVPNLLFAGRNISASHVALSSTRVMATCAVIGQAVGTAAAIAARKNLLPAQLDVSELQALLMDDDCFLPGFTRPIPPLTRAASLIGGNESLRSGIDRPIGEASNACDLQKNESVEFRFDDFTAVRSLRVVFDSDLNSETLTETERRICRPMIANRPLNFEPSWVPKTLVRAYRVEALTESGWQTVAEVAENHQRLCRHNFDTRAKAIRFTPVETWGAPICRLFALEIND